MEREVAASRRAEREHSDALARLSAAREETTRAEREVLTVQEEEKQLRSDLGRVGEERAKALELSSLKTGEMTAMEAAIAGLEAGLESARAARLVAQQKDGEARTARDVLRERRRAAQEAFQTHRNRADAAARRLAELSQQIAALGERKERALLAGEEARERREESVVAVSEAETALKEADASAEQRRAALEELDKATHTAREALDAARRARFEAELVVERRRGDSEHLSETCRTEFGVPPEELPPVERAEGEKEPDDEALAALQEEVVQKTVALERLGPVNHAALEEFDSESKRLQEMSTQKLDLEKSLDQILETIRTINVTSSERFTNAFVAINASFAQVFQRLFGGGTASMQLLDESDPLDSGIEIMAQPPGKRNQTIGLLSGGEKALTAVALLVSIFRYKPSPFCILDEVDAPLDEANIDRFTALLNELSEETQFVLITHSKRTMETRPGALRRDAGRAGRVEDRQRAVRCLKGEPARRARHGAGTVPGQSIRNDFFARTVRPGFLIFTTIWCHVRGRWSAGVKVRKYWFSSSATTSAEDPGELPDRRDEPGAAARLLGQPIQRAHEGLRLVDPLPDGEDARLGGAREVDDLVDRHPAPVVLAVGEEDDRPPSARLAQLSEGHRGRVVERGLAADPRLLDRLPGRRPVGREGREADDVRGERQDRRPVGRLQRREELERRRARLPQLQRSSSVDTSRTRTTESAEFVASNVSISWGRPSTRRVKSSPGETVARIARPRR